MSDKEISVPCNVVSIRSAMKSKVSNSGRADDANNPEPPTIEGMTEHLFEYRKVRDGRDGSVWGISVWAEDEVDARDRLRRAADGEFLGVCYGKVAL